MFQRNGCVQQDRPDGFSPGRLNENVPRYFKEVGELRLLNIVKVFHGAVSHAQIMENNVIERTESLLAVVLPGNKFAPIGIAG